jgi:D-alanine-D-alanine ligase
MGEGRAVLAVLEEVEAVEQALTASGFPTARLPLCPPVDRVRDALEGVEADVVFNLFEGFDGFAESEAMVADLIAETGIPFTGCPGQALSVALDKGKTKELLQAAGVPTPRYQLHTLDTLLTFNLDFPCIVKPCKADASHGLSEDGVVWDEDSLRRQVEKVSTLFGGQALVEEFLDSREFNATVLGNGRPVVLPITEIVYSLPAPSPRILTFAAKWDVGSVYFECTRPVCPADIGPELRRQIIGTALLGFGLLGCRGYARVDLRLDREGQPHVLEVNPNPDLSTEAGVSRQAQAAGMTYGQLIEEIVSLALGGLR